jgi:hypothetical protein
MQNGYPTGFASRRLSQFLSAASICAALCAANVRAQDNPEVGDVRHNPPPPAAEPVAPASRHVVVHTNPFDRDVAVTGTDHAAVIGHLGVGWYGVYSLPYGATMLSGDGTTVNAPSVDAPSIGARYWLNETLAIEGAIGLGIINGGVRNKNGTTTVEVNEPSVFGLALHAALPLALATTQHFTFEIIPELNFGFASGGRELGANDAALAGILLEVGARAGAEIHFGFIGIPQLALQGTVGLRMSYIGRSSTIGNVENSYHHFRFGTTVEGTPWDIFRTNIAAIYYF